MKRGEILECMTRSAAIRAAGLAGEGATAFGCDTVAHADIAYGVQVSSSGHGQAGADIGCSKATRRSTGTGPTTDRMPIYHVRAPTVTGSADTSR